MSESWRAELRAAAQRYISSGCSSLLENAIFLCERLTEGVTGAPELGDVLMHATCLERVGKYRAALGVLGKVGKVIDSSEEARFLKAQCLFKLNMYVDAKACLLYDPTTDRLKTPQEIKFEVETEGKTKTIPKQAYGLHLLGLISHQHAELEEESILYFELAVKMDPFLFQAREKLAQSKGRMASTTPNLSMDEEFNQSSDVLSSIENIAYLIAAYRCDEALQTAASLTSEQQNTGYVLSQIGKAYFEKADYAAACSTYERMRSVNPDRTEGLELYSNALWHLDRKVDLAYLARDMSERAPKSPQTWCIVGNCFSLEKEHDMAIRFFKRAIQLDENFTYAYTLSGHEFVANENFEAATACYRNALRTDRSHYNAWWGLGTIYSRQEKFELAEIHFRRAIAIHPTSSILCTHLAAVLGKMGKFDEALRVLDRAKQLQPSNSQARYLRASVLGNVDRWAEALEELEVVRDALPKDASVHMALGNAYSKLNDREGAMINFVAALDLDPKGAQSVREAINQLNSSTIEESPRDFNIG